MFVETDEGQRRHLQCVVVLNTMNLICKAA
jgi:hypothetical protein